MHVLYCPESQCSRGDVILQSRVENRDGVHFKNNLLFFPTSSFSMHIKIPFWLISDAGRPVLKSLRRLRQQSPEFEASLGYIAKPSLKKNQHTKASIKLLTVYFYIGKLSLQLTSDETINIMFASEAKSYINLIVSEMFQASC